MVLKMITRACVIGAIIATLPGLGARADSLLDSFQSPFENFDCSSAPVLERLKFDGCQFGYLTFDLPTYLEERKAAQAARVEEEEARVWAWFAGPPTTEDCALLPALERAKFSEQCDPQTASTDALSLFQWELERLRGQRDSLASRISSLRQEYERLQARQETIGFSPRASEVAFADFTAVLAALDAKLLQVEAITRLSLELERQSELPFGQVRQLSLVVAPANVVMTADADGVEELGKTTADGDQVIVIDADTDIASSLLLVHPELGLVYANKADFYAD
ncbi:hypothetical protein [uncultured Roseobacter sp.]|uniref:hypothetical protein n=1 Tax=uncultured Roseobacter sp. TaxID=114847 RepID=UPI00261ECBF8|nr:hypothetical protein [uncultured Roseobacter sp.]